MIPFEAEVTKAASLVTGFKRALAEQGMVDLAQHDQVGHSKKTADLRATAASRIRRYFTQINAALTEEVVTAQKATESKVPFPERSYYATIAGQDLQNHDAQGLLALYEEVAQSGNRGYQDELHRVVAPSLLASDHAGEWMTLSRKFRSPEETKADKVAAENISVLKQLQGVESVFHENLAAKPTEALVPSVEEIPGITMRIRENAMRAGASTEVAPQG